MGYSMWSEEAPPILAWMDGEHCTPCTVMSRMLAGSDVHELGVMQIGRGCFAGVAGMTRATTETVVREESSWATMGVNP